MEDSSDEKEHGGANRRGESNRHDRRLRKRRERFRKITRSLPVLTQDETNNNAPITTASTQSLPMALAAIQQQESVVTPAAPAAPWRQQHQHEATTTEEQETQHAANSTDVHRDQSRMSRVASSGLQSEDVVSLASYSPPQQPEPILVEGELVPNEEAVRSQAQMLQEEVNAIRARFSLQPLLVHARTGAGDLEELVENLQAELQDLNRYQSSQQVSLVAVAQQVPETHSQGGIDGLALDDTTIDKRKRVTMVLGVMFLLAVIAMSVGIPLSRNRTNNNTGSTTDTDEFDWRQLGQNLAGKAARDSFGRSVSLSRDGSIIAVGADKLLMSNPPGYVTVFRYDNTQSSWLPMGQDLVGQSGGDSFGRSVSLNGDGTILAVGAPSDNDESGYVQVYQYNVTKGEWSQLGSNLIGQAEEDRFGFSVSLSDSGDILAVGAWSSDTTNGPESGLVRLFRYNTTSWIQMGQTLLGQAAGDEFGYSVSLSSSGFVVGIGARRHASGGFDAGQSSVFQYDSESSTWIPMGLPINGEGAYGQFGFSVSLDDSGQVMAVGSPGFCCPFVGKVFVYEYNGATWTQRGQTLASEEGETDKFGWSVSLSQDGSMMAVGIPRSSGAKGITESGQVQIFRYDTKKWNQVGNNLNGSAEFDRFGWSVSLSGSGTVLGIGAWSGDTNTMEDSGYTKVLTLS